MNNLRTVDAEAAKHAVAPRVTLDDIEYAIAHRFDFTGDQAIVGGRVAEALAKDVVAIADLQQAPAPLKTFSLCILVMRNGFVVVGTSAAASPENFNAEFGINRAYDNALSQLWPLMAFALRDRLAAK